MSLGLGLGLGLSRARGGGSRDMILVYEIPSPNTNIELAIRANSTWFDSGQEVVINWGDGSAKETVSATSGQSGYIGHTYASAGTYTIRISGSMKRYRRAASEGIAGQKLLTHIRSFGKLGTESFRYAFNGCSGLISVPKYCPKNISDMYCMFDSCSGAAFNPDVSNWDVSNVTDMSYMFYGCSGAAFNPDVSNWDVSKVTDMYRMFFNCYGAAFNPDVSNWDVSKVTSMGYMFYNCSGAAFRGGRGDNGNGIANWQLKAGNNAVNMGSFMSNSKTQEPAFLDDILNAWAALHADGKLPTNITVSFGNNKYTADGADAYTTLTTITDYGGAGWTIQSGGLQS